MANKWCDNCHCSESGNTVYLCALHIAAADMLLVLEAIVAQSRTPEGVGMREGVLALEVIAAAKKRT